jgi:hypothetical protein
MKYLFLEFFALLTTMVLVVVSIYIDVGILGNHIPEVSVTEFTQSTVILLTILLFLSKIKKEPESAGLFVLISGLFTMIFIREADYYLDFIYHGFWKVPVFITFCTTIYFAYKNKYTIISPLMSYQSSKAFTYALIGLLITIVFSRLFGTRSLWVLIMEDAGHTKTLVQEGLESLGYSLILMGAFIAQFNKKPQSEV